MMTLYALASIAASAAGWAVALASFAVISGMSLRESRWLTLAGWMCTGAAGVMLGLDPTHYITLANWPMAIMPISLAMVVWGHLQTIREHSQKPARHRVAGPIVAAALLAGCMVVPALAQTTTPKGTYTAVPALPAWEYRAGAGTGALLAGPFETLDLCNDAAEAAAAKADAAKDTKATCRPAGGNVAITFTPKPPVVVPPVVVPPAVTWVLIGPEKVSYTLTGRYKVRFGTGTGVWAVRVIEGAFSCGTTLFGDPAPGAAKRCERESVTTTEPLTAPPVVPPPVVPPPVVEPPVVPPVVVPPSTGGVPARGEFAAFPSIGPVTLQSNATLRRVRVSGPGNCVSIAPGATNVLIEEVEIGPCGDISDNSLGVRIGTGARDITIRRTDTHHVSGCLYSDAGVNPVVYDRNRCTSIRGPSDRRQASRGQMVQLNGVRGGSKGSKITCNVSDQTGADHAVEDHINLYNSAGLPNDRTEVAYNRLRGGHPTSNSGSGIMTGDGSLGGHIWAHHNTIVNVRNVGIGVAGGVDVLVENNRIFMRMPEAQFVNQGMYVWSQGGGTCSGHSVKNNRVNTSSGSFWNGGNCGPVELVGNVYGDASLTAAIFDEVPAQCQ